MEKFWKHHPRLGNYLYILIWGIILFSATFPKTLIHQDVSTLTDTGNIYLGYMYPLAMLFILHIFDLIFIIRITDDNSKRLKNCVMTSFALLVAAIITLFFSVAIPEVSIKVVFFLLCWLSIIALKFQSLKLSEPEIIETKKVDTTY